MKRNDNEGVIPREENRILFVFLLIVHGYYYLSFNVVVIKNQVVECLEASAATTQRPSDSLCNMLTITCLHTDGLGTARTYLDNRSYH